MKNTEKKDVNKPEHGFLERISPDGHGGNISHRRRKRSLEGGGPKWGLAGLVGFSLLVFYIMVMSLLLPAVMPGVLSARLEKAVDWQVDISSFRVTPFSWQWEVQGLSFFLEEGEDNEPFLKVTSIGGGLDLEAFFRGQLRPVEVFVDSPAMLLRHGKSGDFHLPAGLSRYLSELVWLKPGGVGLDLSFFRVENGSVIIDDQFKETVGMIENISFRPREESISVQMLINGEPVTINSGSGSSPESFEFNFDDFSPGPVMAFLLPDSSAVVSGHVGGKLELRFGGSAGGQAVFRGELHLDGIILSRPGSEYEYLAIPVGQVSFLFDSCQRRLIIDKAVFKQPVIRMEGAVQSDWLSELKGMTAGVTVRKMFVEQGKFAVRAGTQVFSLSGLDVSLYRQKDSLPTRFKLSADDVDPFGGRLKIDGVISAEQAAGHLQMSGVDMTFLPAVFREKTGIIKLEGAGELDGEIVLPLNNILHSTFRNLRLGLENIEISTDSGMMLVGGNLLCLSENFVMGQGLAGFSCDRLDISGTEITMPVLFSQDRLDTGNSVGIFADLEIKESRLHLVCPGNMKLVALDDIVFRNREMERGKRELSLDGQIGKNGRLGVSGILNQGQGQLEYDLNGVALTEIDVVSRLFGSSLERGVVRGYGHLSIPEFKAVGELVVEDLSVEQGQVILDFSRLTAPRLSLQAEVPYLSGEEMVLAGFNVNLDGAGMNLSDFAAIEHEWGGYSSYFEIGKIYLQDGSLQGVDSFFIPSCQPDFSGLYGFVDGIFGTLRTVELKGMMDSGRFKLNGRIKEGDFFGELELHRPSLSPVELEFLAEHGLDGGQMSFSLRQISEEDGEREKAGKAEGGEDDVPRQVFCQLSHLYPLPDSDFSFILSMLTDRNGVLDLQFSDESSGFLLESMLVELQRLREQVRPETALSTEFPLFDLPPSHLFVAGQAENDSLFYLDDYVELLALRPRLRLILTGGFELETDGEVLQVILQQEADSRREVENLKRQFLRQQVLAGHEREEISEIFGPIAGDEGEAHENLQLLSETVVDVPVELLRNLALKRRDMVWNYLVHEKGVAAGQVVRSDNLHLDTAAVVFQVTGRPGNR